MHADASVLPTSEDIHNPVAANVNSVLPTSTNIDARTLSVSVQDNGNNTPASIEFFDVANNKNGATDSEDLVEVDVQRRLTKLITLAKKHKSAVAHFKLYTLKMYLDLYEQYRRNPCVAKPAQQANLSVARLVWQGPYFARQLRHLKLYIHCFGTLPPNWAEKHYAHPSLLNNEEILLAVLHYLTVLADGKVSNW